MLFWGQRTERLTKIGNVWDKSDKCMYCLFICAWSVVFGSLLVRTRFLWTPPPTHTINSEFWSPSTARPQSKYYNRNITKGSLGRLLCSIFLGKKMGPFHKRHKNIILCDSTRSTFITRFFWTPVWHGDLDHSKLQHDPRPEVAKRGSNLIYSVYLVPRIGVTSTTIIQ